MDCTQPTLDCPDRGTLAFSQDSITHLSSATRAGGETTSESRRQRGLISLSHFPGRLLRGLKGAPCTSCSWDSSEPCLRGLSTVEGPDGCGTAGHPFSTVATVNMVVGQYRVPECLARRTGHGRPLGFVPLICTLIDWAGRLHFGHISRLFQKAFLP